MAASGFTSIVVYYSTTSGNEPVPGDMEIGEIALNIADGIFFTKDASNDIVRVGGLYDGASLPTSDPFVAGALYNDGGIVKVSNG